MFGPPDPVLSFDITKPPPPVDDSFPHCKLLEQLRQSDEVLVREFMSSRTLQPSLITERKPTSPRAPVDIRAYRAELCDALKALEALKHSKLALENLLPDEGDARVWSDAVERTGQLKNALLDQLNALEAEERLTSLTRKLAVRKKKRAWQKRRNERLKKANEARETERAVRLEEISRWETEWNIRLAKERAAREELQAKTLVLADVRRRKARAKRYLGRFEKTIQLHRERQRAEKAKHPTLEMGCPEEDTGERFRKNVDALIGEWKGNLTECMREERRLKDELARRSAGNESRRRENRWRKALFGDAAAAGGRAPTDRYDIIETRWAWDAYALPLLNLTDAASTERVPSGKGYTVPAGWVFPPENPLPEWAIYREPAKIKAEKNIGISRGGNATE